MARSRSPDGTHREQICKSGRAARATRLDGILERLHVLVVIVVEVVLGTLDLAKVLRGQRAGDRTRGAPMGGAQ